MNNDGDGPRRTVLITGTSSGIGLATAIACAREGFATVATMRDPGRARPRCSPPRESAGVEVDVRQLDVTDPYSVEACVADVEKAYGRLDALVNNAGVASSDPTMEMSTMAALRANMEVNFFGVIAVSRLAMPLLRASGGRLVTVGSVHGVVGQPFNESYCAAKSAVEGFMEALAPVAAAQGVTVSIVVPGFVPDTSFGIFPDVEPLDDPGRVGGVRVHVRRLHRLDLGSGVGDGGADVRRGRRGRGADVDRGASGVPDPHQPVGAGVPRPQAGRSGRFGHPVAGPYLDRPSAAS